MARLDPAGAAFVASAFLTLGSGVVVAFSRSVTSSLLALVGVVVGVGGLYVLLSAGALAALEVVGFGGAIALLALAALATVPRDALPTSNESERRRPAFFAALVLSAGFAVVAIDTIWPAARPSTIAATTSHAPGLGLALGLAALVAMASLVAARAVVRRAPKAEPAE
jgi:NADH:ubiquinone oxidoreductase subunit 6 (subunit J)